MDPSPNTYDVGDAVILSCSFTTGNTLGSVDAGSALLTVQDASGFAQGDPILVAGAGGAGGDHYTTVSSVAGSVITLAVSALTSVSRVAVGKLTDPTTVTCKVKLPDGSTATPSNSKLSTGRYTATYTTTQSGDHYVRWTAAGAAVGAEERQFLVRSERV